LAFLRLVMIALLVGMLPTCSGSVDQGDGGDGTDVEDACDGDEAGDLGVDAADGSPQNDHVGDRGSDGDAGEDGDGGPVLSDALVSGCFNWPAEEFTTDNHAQVQTIAAGALAVEFTLEDLDGVAYTLSELLAQKPVLMVFGAYT
jgi:hypothetical protein